MVIAYVDFKIEKSVFEIQNISFFLYIMVMNNPLQFIITPDESKLQGLITQNKTIQLDFEKNFQAQEQTLKIFLMSIHHCTLKGFDEDKVIWNAAGSVNIISLDLKHLIADMMFATDEWKKRLHGRTVSMLIYESLNDLFQLLGKDFKPIIQKFSNFNSIDVQLKEIKKRLNIYKQFHFDSLQTLRNVATAHRDSDVVKQVKAITEMGWLSIFNYAKEFDEILNDLGKCLMLIINTSVDELRT